MISSVLFPLLFAIAIRAGVVPTAPGPGQVFKEGGDCTLSWNLDTTGKWTSFTVDLMSGSNFAMKHVTNVFQGRDGTKGDTTYTWKCPQVTPNSNIYFYQFTQAGADTTWTTRFAISSPSGALTPPEQSTQPGGAAIPWGIGTLKGDGAAATPTITPPPSGNTTALNMPGVANSTSTSNYTNATVGTTAGSNMTVPLANGTSSPSNTPTQSTSSSNSPSTSPNSQPSTGTSSSKPGSTAPPPAGDASHVLPVSHALVATFALAAFAFVV